MDNKQTNRVNMFKTVSAYLADHNSVWNGTAPFAAAVTQFNNNIAAIDTSAQKQETDMADQAVIERDVIQALRRCYDPEIPVDIYELGLIYGLRVAPDGAVDVRMTLTAPNCPAAQELPAEVERAVRSVPGVTAARVEITFDPPWDSCKMSDAAKLKLGLL